jgi:hypothetical protein
MLFAPGIAAGKPGYEVQPRGLSLKMSLRSSNDYRISISASGHRLVLLSAANDDVSANYTVKGRVSRDSLDANFGKVGRISVRFHGTPKPLPANPLSPTECHGRPPIHEVGRFEGTIRFRGERGFTAVAVKDAKGSVVRRFRRVCKLPPWLQQAPGHPKHGDHPTTGQALITFLAAASQARNRVVSFDSIGAEIPPTSHHRAISITFIFAGLQERRGRVSIDRSTFVAGDSGSVLASPPGVKPATATVALPPPFDGTGSFTEVPEAAPSWTGSLAVQLPGAGNVPLTGPDFAAALCQGRSIEELKPCLAGVTAKTDRSRSGLVLGRLQGSGSHSQALAEARLSWSR